MLCGNWAVLISQRGGGEVGRRGDGVIGVFSQRLKGSCVGKAEWIS